MSVPVNKDYGLSERHLNETNFTTSLLTRNQPSNKSKRLQVLRQKSWKHKFNLDMLKIVTHERESNIVVSLSTSSLPGTPCLKVIGKHIATQPDQPSKQIRCCLWALEFAGIQKIAFYHRFHRLEEKGLHSSH